jgi:hypothetical protein
MCDVPADGICYRYSRETAEPLSPAAETGRRVAS